MGQPQEGQEREGSGTFWTKESPPSPTATQKLYCGCHGARPCPSLGCCEQHKPHPTPHPHLPGNTAISMVEEATWALGIQ